MTDSTDGSKIEKLCYGNNPANCDTYSGLFEFFEAMAYPAICAGFDWLDSTICEHGKLPTGNSIKVPLILSGVLRLMGSKLRRVVDIVFMIP